MRKLKFLILTLLSVLTLGLFIVTGSKAEAAVEDGTYYALASDFAVSGSYDFSKTTNTIQNLFTISGSFTNDSGNLSKNGKYDLTSVKTKNPDDDENTCYTIGIKAGGTSGREISLDLAQNQKASITVVAYTTSKDRFVTIGGVQNDISQNSTAELTGTLTSTNNVIVIGGCSFTEIVAVISTSDRTYSSVEVTNNKTSYYVGDSVSTSDLTVNAVYSDNTKDNNVTGYTLTVDNATPTAFTSSDIGTNNHTVKVSYTIGEVTKETTYTISVSDVTKYTVTYYDENGTEKTKDIIEGEEFDVVLAKRGSKFIGWSQTENGQVLSDLTITAKTTLYPVFSNMITLTKGVEKTFDFSTISGSNDKFSSDMMLTVYSSDVSKMTVDTSKKTIKLGGNGSSSDKYVGFVIPGNSTARIRVNATLGGSNNTYLKVECCSKIAIIDMGNVKDKAVDKEVFITNTSNDSERVYMYRTAGSDGQNVSSVTINSLKVFADTRISTFYCQYNTSNPANATKIRFIAALDGIDDVTAINTVTFSITVGGDTKEFKCTQLYSSIANQYASLGSSDGRCYAVYALTGIENAIAKEVAIQSLSVTITFTEASGLSPITASHAGFTIGE